MIIQEIECKTALSTSTLPGLTYSLNPYRGCQHNCAYCYAPNVLRLPREHWGDTIQVKKNISVVLAREIRKKDPGVIGISTVTDPYQPVEKKYTLTRCCLEQLLHYDFPTHIQTKSALVVRDINLLTKFSDSQVMFSIGTLYDNERQLLEPNTSSIQDRISALQTCAAAGLKTAVFFGPVYPTVSIEDIPRFLDILKDAGAQELWIDQLRLKPGIWQQVQQTLKQDQKIYQKFSEAMQHPLQYYSHIRDEMRKQAKQRNLCLIDAF